MHSKQLPWRLCCIDRWIRQLAAATTLRFAWTEIPLFSLECTLRELCVSVKRSNAQGPDCSDYQQLHHMHVHMHEHDTEVRRCLRSSLWWSPNPNTISLVQWREIRRTGQDVRTQPTWRESPKTRHKASKGTGICRSTNQSYGTKQADSSIFAMGSQRKMPSSTTKAPRQKDFIQDRLHQAMVYEL